MIDEQGHLRDLVAAYVLDAVTPEEAAQVQEHLAGCPLCRRLESELREVQSVLSDLADERTPPPALKARLMATVEREARPPATGPALPEPPAAPPPQPGPMVPPRRVPAPPGPAPRPRDIRPAARWYPLLAAAAVLALLAVGVGAWRLLSGGQSGPTTYRMAGTPAQPSIQGTLNYYKDGGRLVLDLHGLKRIPANRVYELWLIRGTSVVVGVGVFRPGADGSGHITLHGQNVPSYTLAGLTVERAPRSATPHLPIVASAKLA